MKTPVQRGHVEIFLRRAQNLARPYCRGPALHLAVARGGNFSQAVASGQTTARLMNARWLIKQESLMVHLPPSLPHLVNLVCSCRTNRAWHVPAARSANQQYLDGDESIAAGYRDAGSETG